MTDATAAPSGIGADDLDGFRRAQRLAYDCAEAVAATLEPGVTEKDAAHAMRRWLSDAGVDGWFHLPFAWFGDRTAFRGLRLPHNFFPSNRALEDTMPYILDCAPIVDGYTGDIGYSSSLGANVVAESLADDLAQHRCLILAEVRAGASQGQVYRAVDKLLARQGNDNRHQAYPFGVIAHRFDPVGGRFGRGHRTAFGFGVGPIATLFRSVVAGAPARRAPLWNRGRFSVHPPVPGLWAVEPHLGRGAVGAKFEELLVVTGDEAFWLDDDVPHVRRWHERGLA